MQEEEIKQAWNIFFGGIDLNFGFPLCLGQSEPSNIKQKSKAVWG